MYIENKERELVLWSFIEQRSPTEQQNVLVDFVERRINHTHDLEIMERAERIDKICNMARSLYARGLDPNDYVDEIFESVGIDVDSLSSDEIDKINRACR